MLVHMTVRGTSAVLVGREAELAALRSALKRADTTEPVTVLLGGEAGVGKTRLVDDFGRYATTTGARVLVGRCTELGEDGPPFAPFVAALRELLRRDGAAAFAGFEADFSRLLPELAPAEPVPLVHPGRHHIADRFPDRQAGAGRPAAPAPVAATPPVAAPDGSRAHLFDLMTGLLDRLATDRPLVLILDDLHWADRSTRDLLAFLVRQARVARVLLVGVYRSDELHRGHPLRAFLAELERVRGVERLELGRLDRDGTTKILTELYAEEPTEQVVDNIHERTQGNPFFIEQLALASGPAIDGFLPESLRDLLLARVDKLPEPAQKLLRIAAAGGQRVSHQLLATVAELPETELEEAMRAVISSQLVVVEPDSGYAFRHALVREAVHDDLLPGEHARLHARYAAAIEAEPGLAGGAGPALSAVAYHWHAAHDHPRALTAALRAATAAGERFAYAEKCGLLERVLELWEQVPDAADRIGMSHLEVLEEGLYAAEAAGDRVRSLQLARAALAEVDQEREPLRAARLLERQSHMLAMLGKSDGVAEARAAYRLASRVPDAAARAPLLADIALAIMRVDWEEGGRIAREAAATAQDLGDVAARVSATITQGRVCSRQVSPEVGLAELRRAAAEARQAGDGRGLVRALVNISDLLYEVGEYAESAETAGSGIAEAARLGVSRSKGAFLISNRAEALLALGEWDEAEQLCAQSARLDLMGAKALHRSMLRARLRLARGHPEAKRSLARVFAFLARPYLEDQFRLPLQELRITAAMDDPPAAVAVATEVLDSPALVREPRYAWPLLAAAARAAALAGSTQVRDLVLTLAEKVEVRYPAERAFAAQVTAEFADHAEAYPAWQAAVAAWRADGQPYPRAGALLRLAEAAAAVGERAVAADAVGEARGIAVDLAVTPLTVAADTLVRRLGLRGVGPPGQAPAREALTRREQEVLRLVAAGYSNRRIAEELYITPKTASVHVSRIIAKLGAGNRTEAAAVARKLGLLPDESAAA